MSYAQFDVALYFHNHYSTKPQIKNLCLVTRITLSSQDFISFKASFSFLFRLFLGFRILLGLNKSFSIASMKSSKLLHLVSFERNNLDVVDFFLGGFGTTLILPAVGGSDKIS